VLLPAEGVLFYAEIAAPARVHAAARNSPLIRAFMHEDEKGERVEPRAFPGEDERSLRHAVEDADQFRRASFIFSLFKAPMLCALVQHPSEPRPAVLMLTRSEPDAFKSIMSTMLSFTMSASTEERRGVVIASFLDPEDPGDSFQHAQLGDVFAICYGTANPAIMRDLADAWFRPRPEHSFAPKARRARALVEAISGAGEAEREREWAFATGDGRAMFEFALRETEKWLERDEEKDAAFWLGIAETTKRAGWFGAQCRGVGSGKGARLELRCVANHERPIWSDAAFADLSGSPPPDLDAILGGLRGDFALEASRADSAAALAGFFLPSRRDGAQEGKSAIRERLDELKRMPRSDANSPVLAMSLSRAARVDGASGLSMRGWVASTEGGGAFAAFDSEIARSGDDPEGRFAAAGESGEALRLFAWPESPEEGTPKTGTSTTSGEAAALLADASASRWTARFAMNGASLDDDDFWQWALDLTSRIDKPGDRRDTAHYLQALRGARAEFASATARDGSSWSLLRLAFPGAADSAAPSDSETSNP
jgi:hypothetical protein